MSVLLNPSEETRRDARRALLAERLRKAADAPLTTPLSFAQQRLWFLDQLEPNSPLYNVPSVLELAGRLDVNALQKALDGLVARHEILRTRFVDVEGNPAQVVDANLRLKLEVHDLSHRPTAERRKEAQAIVRDEVNRPFDLSAGLPIRATLVRLQAQDHWFVLNMHHIVSDEWSLKICFQELGELYEASCQGRPAKLPELAIQYTDYTLWQREWLKGEVLEEQLAFWREQLRGNPPVLELPTDHPRSPMQTFRGSIQSLALPGKLAESLTQLGARCGATLSMVTLAAFKVLLHRYTQLEDIVVGSPIAGRNRIETERLIGFFVNTLLLRTNASGDPTFEELLGRVRETTLNAYAHEDLPFEKLVEKLHPERAATHTPFTRVMFLVQNSVLEELHWPNLTLRFVDCETETAKFDLTLVVQATRRGLVVQAEYNRDLFDSETITRLLQHFEVLLNGVVENSRRRLSELPLLAEGEVRKVITEWNDTKTDYPRAKCIHELFEAQVERTPAAVAVVFGNKSVTYQELNNRANRLARYLGKFSVGPDVPVGICLERSVEMIVGMLAILKAGGAYVPIEATYPKERLAFMLADAGAPVLLTQQRLVGRLPRTAHALCLDSDWELIARESGGNIRNPATPENLAYVIYTSGSTGAPKGVAVPHRAVNRLVLNTNYIRFTADDRVAQVSNASFDAATFEIWGALLNGGTVVGITRDVTLSPADFARELREQNISAMFLTAALFNQLAAEVPGAFETVRTVMFGGEAGDPKSVARVLKHKPPQRLVNGYGPTENTTFSACYEVRAMEDDATTVLIGRPISNSQCYILDSRLNPMPIGVPGELHVGGEGLARGYWKQPELTAEKFIANPFRPGERLYKTGDLARWLPDGTIEFLGRLDEQVKIRGFRIELGEIEAVLGRHPAIRECVVTLNKDETGNGRLIAYFVPGGKRAPSFDELTRFLKEKLPDYMVPAIFVLLDTLPLTPNGKVDRRALPHPGRGRHLMQGLATPRDAVEVKLTEIWENVLDVRPVGIEDKFFDLGGHSLLAVKLIAQIEKVFGKRLRVATVFQAPTVEQLAAVIREEIQEESALAGTSLVEIQSQGTHPPLFLVHGAGGGMFWGYVNLSRYLGAGQPVYGLKSRGLDGQEELESIEEMAAQYVKDIRALQPHGPFHLGGYCFGGIVAFEMARQLEAQGEAVALLALFNCSPPNSDYDRVSWTPKWLARFGRNLLYWAKYFRTWTPAQRREFFRWKKEVLKQRFDRVLGRDANTLLKVDAGNRVDLSSFPADQRNLWRTHIGSLLNYRPRPYSGRVHLFRSPGHPLICSFEADYGWSGLARGGVDISIVPGVHEKILEEPCVRSLAVELKARMDEVRSTGTVAPQVSSEIEKRQVDYWRQRLNEAPALLDLPADRPRPAHPGGVRARQPVVFSRQMADALEDFGKREKCTPFMVLLAVFKVLLFRYTGATDIVLGSRLGDCRRAGMDNLLALRSDFGGDPEFRQFLQRVRDVVKSALANDAVSFERIVAELVREGDTGYAPIFQVMFDYGDKQPGSPEVAEPVPVSAAICDQVSRQDLILSLAKTAQGLVGWFDYSTSLFDAERIARMAEHLETLLQAILREPAGRISALPILPEHEARKVLMEWNTTEKDYPRDATLAELFEAQVKRTPELIALVDGTERITYAELNARANQLASRLRTLGVGAGKLVGVSTKRSWRMLVAILGTLKAGGAYVPLDPAYPKDRLAFILEDTNAPVLLTEQALPTLHVPQQTRVVCLDADWAGIATCSRENLPGAAGSDDLAYVIYTSGSTGKPKGVALEHRNAVALVYWARDVFAREELAGVLASTSICFDLSVFEMFVPLSWGGTVILAENALALPGLPAAMEVTLVNTVPSAIRELVRVKGVPANVRVVNLAGEPLITPLVNQIYGETSVEKVYDLYGPSETTTYSTFTLRSPDEPATIGRPLANEQVYLLDKNLKPVPIGVPGEIYIGGAGVARGYLNRVELTAERFLEVSIPSPGCAMGVPEMNGTASPRLNDSFAHSARGGEGVEPVGVLNSRKHSNNGHGACDVRRAGSGGSAMRGIPAAVRLYKTGDLARWRTDGNLEFLGRSDHQVKIRGFRIELGEIESVLRKHPGLRESVVVVREDRPGDKRLAAYVVRKPDAQADAEDVRRFVRQALPEYMVPAAIVFLEALPLTPNGKLDRKALPVPKQDRPGNAEFVEPQSTVEEQFAAIWREVLGIERIGVTDNFFELGGHSLLAIQVISRVREKFNTELPLSGLFDAPTIRQLAQALDSGEWERNEVVPLMRRASRDGGLPLSFVQERLWFLDQISPGGNAYNVPAALRLKGVLDVPLLQRALNEVVRRHEALRTTFANDGGKLVQVIAPSASLEIEVANLESVALDERGKRVQAWVNAEARRSFDLARGPLIRVKLARLGATEHVLSVVMHHAISDGWSLTILFDELAAFYGALVEGQSLPALPELLIQYADFANWQQQSMQGAKLEQELAYWKTKLGGAPAELNLPVDRAGQETGAPASGKAARAVEKFQPATAEALAAFSHRENVTPFTVLMTALAITFEKWARQRDMVMGTVVAGRTRREMENIIGCFMNFLPIRAQIGGEETGKGLLAKVRAAVLEAQTHQDCPFEQIVKAVNPERGADKNPLYNVALLLQNFPEQMFRNKDLQVAPMEVDMEAALLDLRFEAEFSGQNLLLSCEYKTDLFEAGTIAQLLASYRGILEMLLQSPEAKLREFGITAELERQARSSRAGEVKFAIAGTFTVEPVEESLRYWMKELELRAKIEFAPFNQVFQQLLDPASLLARNGHGANVVLVRLEDWVKGDGALENSGAGTTPPSTAGGKPAATAAETDRLAREFIADVKAATARSSVPMLVVLCPSSPQYQDAFKAAGELIAAELEKLGGVHVVTTEELLALYPVEDFYEARGDELGCVPYTPVFFTALGTMIARKIHLLQRAQHKVIVLDCDQTLWGGVCGEDGPRGICLDEPRRALQEFMRAQRAAGRLLVLCSKNNEEDVREVFAQRLDMPLRREHFATARLNWSAKSENIKSIAQELNLGLDSFIFVDDNPVECAEVEANCPEVLTLQLPEKPAEIPQFLKHCWAFDVSKVTAEDARRSEMYSESRRREESRAQAGSLADFIAGLNLKIRIEPMSEEQVPRVAQLTQRTNQFNLTTIRRTEAEIQQIRRDGGSEGREPSISSSAATVLTVSVSDRFGDYGLVGVVIFEARGETLDVETFLLSCRVLGRGVEHEILARLGSMALEQKKRWVSVHFHPSPKNKPALDFLQGVGAAYKQALNGGFVYVFPAEFAAEVTLNPRGVGGAEEQGAVPGIKDKGLFASAAAKFGQCRAIAIEADDAGKIHQAIERKAEVRAGTRAGYVPPRTEIERQICESWQRLLHVERVGVADNFFELGGHSLLAVRLFAELEKITGRKLPLVTLFQAPTVEQLARAMEGVHDAPSRSVLVAVQATGTLPPLFLVHGAGGDVLWGYANLAKHMNPGRPIYGIKSRGQVGLEEYDQIEDMARFYLKEVRALQPHGPYFLGGYCFGGNVAYEMARQLHSQGERVAQVMLIDASPSNAGYEKILWWRPRFYYRFARNLYYWLEDFRTLLDGKERRRYFARKGRVLWRKLVGKLRGKTNSAEVDLDEVIDVNHFPESELKFWRIHLRALVNHVERPYAGGVALLRTRGQPMWCSFEDDFCWGKLARGGVVVKHIPGSHENTFVEPNARFLAEKLEECLAEAQTPATSENKKPSHEFV